MKTDITHTQRILFKTITRWLIDSKTPVCTEHTPNGIFQNVHFHVHKSGTSNSPAVILSITSCGCDPSTVHPTDWHVPSISFTVPAIVLAMLRGRIVLAMSIIASNVKLPLCLMFLTFFAVPWRLFQCFNNKWRCCWNNINLCLSILNSQLDSDSLGFPLLWSLCNIPTNFLWWKTKWTDLWCQWRCGTNFTTNNSDTHNFNLTGIKLRRHIICLDN